MLNKKAYFPGVDGLRAVAILSVLVYHLNSKWLPGGFSGVDMFFVISGFVVSHSLWRDSQLGMRDFFARFYCRRIVRIYPALIASLVFSVLLLVLFIPDSWLGRANKATAMGAFFGVSNFALIRFSDGYFGEGSEYNPFLHTWSLAVEEQFYFIFPLLFVSWIRFRSLSIRYFRISSAIFPIAILGSMVLAMLFTVSKPSWAFFLLPFRFWELGVGFLVFRIGVNFWRQVETYRNPLQWVGAASLITGFLSADQLGFPWPGALLPVFGCSALILSLTATSQRHGTIGKILEYPISVLIGRMSYSLYLWHWPFVVLAHWTTGLETVLEYFCVTSLTLIVAYASWRFIEIPILNSARIQSLPRAWIFAGAFAIILLVAGISALALKSHSLLTFSVTRNRAVWYPEFRASIPADIHLIPTPLDGIHAKIVRRAGFDQSFPGPKIFLIGDSHASAYWPIVANLAITLNIEAQMLAKPGCSLAGFLAPSAVLNPECIEYLELIEKHLVTNARPGDVILIGSIKARRFDRNPERGEYEKPDLSGHSDSALHLRDAAVIEFIAFADRLRNRGVKIVLDGVKPIFPSSAYRCSDWFNRTNPACTNGLDVPRKFLLERSKPQIDALAEVLLRTQDVYLWDTFEELCPGPTCHAMFSDNPLFFDTDHLSGLGINHLYASLERRMLPLLESAHP
jgi:peptidoglycan/LPS O-acetylase OafA/YrhL